MPASPVVQLRVPGDVLAAVDETRGETSRSAWILAAITSRLSPPAAVDLRDLMGADGTEERAAAALSPRSVTGTGLTADMLPALDPPLTAVDLRVYLDATDVMSQPKPAPKPKTRRAPAAEKPRAASGGCKHEHVLKGWCRECRTGGH